MISAGNTFGALIDYKFINILNVEKNQKYVNMEEMQWMELQLVQNVVDV